LASTPGSKFSRHGGSEFSRRRHDSGKTLIFLTNHMALPALTIAALYKSRWQVELFFKWIKQNLKIKSFLGITLNAVITQIMVALCVYLILAWMKFTFSIKHSLMQIIRLLQLNLFVKRAMIELFIPPDPKPKNSPQLRLAL
jgi:Transposase DDE domain